MRKVFFFAAIASVVLASCAGKPELVINGTTDSESDMAYVLSGKDTLATAPIVDGAFKVTVPVDEMNPGFLTVIDGPRSRGTVVAEKGAVTYKNADHFVSVAGTALNDAYQAYRDASKALNEKFQNASEEDVAAIYEESDNLTNKFYEDNASNFLGLYMLRSSLQYEMDADELEAALAKLDAKTAGCADAVKLAERVEKLKKTAIGNDFIEIKLADREGNDIALSSVVGEGKYVLVDFWASWCGPCMRELPYLLQAYADFHDKGFEIFGVSLDAEKDAWTKAIDDNNMSWIHVSDIKYWDCAAAADYGVNSIPANWLVGPDGKFIAKGLRGEALCAKLAELLGE